MTPNTLQLSDSAFPIKIGNETYFASMLCDRDYGDLTQYIRSELIRYAIETVKDLSPDIRSDIYQAAVKAAATSGWGTLEGARIISSSDGALMLGWVMIRKRHPKVSLKAFKDLCKANLDEAISQINIAFTHLNYLVDVEEEATKDGESSSEESKS